MEAPSRPVLLLPSPWRPRSAVCSGLKRKCSSVLWCWLATKKTSPPLPPSPPLGPPRGTYFSRRNARQPLPPSPAFTRILTSSMNIEAVNQDSGPRPEEKERLKSNRLAGRFDADEFSRPAAVAKHNDARNLGEQRIVLAAPDVVTGLEDRAALPHQN